MARFTKLSVLCLYCFIGYLQYIYISCHLYRYMIVLLYIRIERHISIYHLEYPYLHIDILLSIHIACHMAIFIFFYLYFCFRFFGSTSIFYHEPKSHPLAFNFAKLWQPWQTPSTSRFSPYRGRYFCSSLPQSKIEVFHKNISPDYLAYCLLGATILYCT